MSDFTDMLDRLLDRSDTIWTGVASGRRSSLELIGKSLGLVDPNYQLMFYTIAYIDNNDCLYGVTSSMSPMNTYAIKHQDELVYMEVGGGWIDVGLADPNSLEYTQWQPDTSGEHRHQADLDNMVEIVKAELAQICARQMTQELDLGGFLDEARPGARRAL